MKKYVDFAFNPTKVIVYITNITFFRAKVYFLMC